MWFAWFVFFSDPIKYEYVIKLRFGKVEFGIFWFDPTLIYKLENAKTKIKHI